MSVAYRKTKLPREDAHYLVVKGRRWRKTDPDIPEKLRADGFAAANKGNRSSIFEERTS